MQNGSDNRYLPPASIEAEMSILGGISLDFSKIDTVHTLITVDDFYRESHRKIFRAMTNLADKGDPIDLVTLSTALKSAGELEEIGGAAYLATLIDYVPTAENIAYYCKIVKDRAFEREVITKAQTAIETLQGGGTAAEAVQCLESLNNGSSQRSSLPRSIRQIIKVSIKGIEDRHENKGQLQGISYGIEELDKATNGLQRQDLVIIAGRPSMGKSACAGNIIESACKLGKTALLFSLEMSGESIVDRLLSANGSIAFHRIRNGWLEGNDWEKLCSSAAKINDWPLYIDDTPGLTLREIKAKAKRQAKDRLDLIVLDYLQLMTLLSKESRTQAIGEVSRGLKTLARELNVPIVALSQLSRQLEARTDKRPIMSDLRDSGEIEQDADVILFPYRPAVYCTHCKNKETDDKHDYLDHQMKAEIIVGKQRNGESNISIPAAWMGQYQRFAAVDEYSRY